MKIELGNNDTPPMIMLDGYGDHKMAFVAAERLLAQDGALHSLSDAIRESSEKIVGTPAASWMEPTVLEGDDADTVTMGLRDVATHGDYFGDYARLVLAQANIELPPLANTPESESTDAKVVVSTIAINPVYAQAAVTIEQEPTQNTRIEPTPTSRRQVVRNMTRRVLSRAVRHA